MKTDDVVCYGKRIKVYSWEKTHKGMRVKIETDSKEYLEKEKRKYVRKYTKATP